MIIHGDAGDMTGSDMHDGTLVIHGNTIRVVPNMTGGTCTVHGTVRDMMPTFQKGGREMIDGIEYARFTGDIANRGKGILFIRNYQYME